MAKMLPLDRWQLMHYVPNEWSLNRVHLIDARVNTATTARQVGKTETGAIELDLGLIEQLPDDVTPHVGLVAPTYGKARLMIDKLEERYLTAFGRDYYKTNYNDHTLWLPHSGARFRWMSADDPKSVTGFTFTKVETDESQDIPDAVMDKLIPTMSVHSAKLLSFGTPDITPEQTWFKDNWVRGQDEDWEGYASTTVTAYENPWMGLEDVLDAQRRLTEREFAMLYLGQWVDEEGGVFQNYDGAFIHESQTPKYDVAKRYCMGIDLAIHDDFNVVFIAEATTRQVIGMWRWNREHESITYDRIVALWEDHGRPYAVADASGLGRPMVSELQNRDMQVAGLVITASNKLPMVKQLAADVEHRRIMFPPYPALTREMRAFMYHATSSGKLTARAASGYNDDTIMALVMLNEALRIGGGNSTTKPASWVAKKRHSVRDKIRMLNV